MKASDLQPFCDPHRNEISKPFSRGDFTFATDGRMLIRVPRIPGVGEDGGCPTEDLDRAVTFDGREPFNFDDVTEWIPLPEFPHETFRAVCDECAEDPHLRITDDCATCNGIGTVISWRAKCRAVRIGNRYLAPYFLRKLQDLPSAEISAQYGNPNQQVFLRFHGGVGVLMPMTIGDIQEDEIFTPAEPAQTPTEEK